MVVAVIVMAHRHWRKAEVRNGCIYRLAASEGGGWNFRLSGIQRSNVVLQTSKKCEYINILKVPNWKRCKINTNNQHKGAKIGAAGGGGRDLCGNQGGP